MYLKSFFIFLLLSLNLGHSHAQEIPENLKEFTEFVMKIQVKGLDDKGEKRITHGTGFLTKNRKGKLRVVTNFHVIDSIKSVKSISAQNDSGKSLSLDPEAFSSIHDIAFLKPIGDQKHLEKVLQLRKYPPPEEGEKLYMLSFIAEEEHLTLIPMDFLFVLTQWNENELSFKINSPITDLQGASGSPIMDETGKVVGLLTGEKQGSGFGVAANLLSYSVNGNLIQCDKLHSIAKRHCILQARQQLFEKLKSEDKATRRGAESMIYNMYSDNIDDFIQSITETMEISEADKKQLSAMKAVLENGKAEEAEKAEASLIESANACKKSVLK